MIVDKSTCCPSHQNAQRWQTAVHLPSDNQTLFCHKPLFQPWESTVSYTQSHWTKSHHRYIQQMLDLLTFEGCDTHAFIRQSNFPWCILSLRKFRCISPASQHGHEAVSQNDWQQHPVSSHTDQRLLQQPAVKEWQQRFHNIVLHTEVTQKSCYSLSTTGKFIRSHLILKSVPVFSLCVSYVNGHGEKHPIFGAPCRKQGEVADVRNLISGFLCDPDMWLQTVLTNRPATDQLITNITNFTWLFL